MDTHATNKKLLQPLREALYNYEAENVERKINEVFSADALIQLACPFETMEGPKALSQLAFAPLHHAVPDLERRETIVISGSPDNQTQWVGCAGYYTGTFIRPWLDIPPTGHQLAMRCHEFYRFEDQKVVELQALWDLPEVMIQAGVWPMSPSLGREWHVPGPATQDGIINSPQDPMITAKSRQLVLGMLEALGQYASGGVEAMRLEDFWHPNFSWYGPSGIGTARGISGFRNWHQIPFLNGMPNRTSSVADGHLFSEGEYTGFTAWPGMQMTITGDGFLGIAPADQNITMRSLDFWRCENGKIRENWVLVDLIDVYRQIGVEVFMRLKEFNKARHY